MPYDPKKDARRFTAIHEPMTGYNPLNGDEMDLLSQEDVALMAIENTGKASYMVVNFHHIRKVLCPRHGIFMDHNHLTKTTAHHLKFTLFYKCLQPEGNETCNINVYPDIPLEQAENLMELPASQKPYIVNDKRKPRVP